MISHLANDATLPLVERVIEQKINLAPVPGSPLALVVEASLNPQIALMECSGDGTDVAVISNFSQLSTQDSYGEEPNIHAMELNSITEAVANSVRITMDVARNKVNPVVTTIVREIDREFKENVYNYGLNVELCFADEVALMKNDAFLSMVSNNRLSGNVREIPSLNCFASISRDRLPEFLKTNVDTVDADIANWFNTFGNDRLSHVFDLVFVRNGDRGYNIYDWIRDDVDFAIATYLIARHFITNDNALEHVSDISLSELKAGLTIVMAASATVINAMRARVKATKDRDVLVHSYPGRGANVTNAGSNVEVLRVMVHKDKFDEFIDKGGNVDMIYGNVLENNRMYTVDDVLENGRVTQRRWESHALALRNKSDSRKYEVFKRAILSSLSQWIRDNDEDGFSLEPIMNEARGLVGKLTYADMGNIYDVVLSIVDQVLFANTDAVKFLRIMNKYAVDQPDLDMRHVATLAAYEYTAAWVSSMIIAEK
jgi:hypothetical protein